MLPQVTVAIPTYNGARRLPLMLRNLTAQDAVDGSFEVVVVDNNSTDDTAAVVCLSGGQVIAAFYEPHLKLKHLIELHRLRIHFSRHIIRVIRSASSVQSRYDSRRFGKAPEHRDDSHEGN
jgi:cellulose synthase/poly-beta-1,6-N-acetylglucosamine synthase-like glycosyltransferase